MYIKNRCVNTAFRFQGLSVNIKESLKSFCFPSFFSRKQTFWFDGEEYVQYGRWYSCCNSCLINCYELCTCQKCQNVRPSGNRKADVWRSTNGGPWMPENAKMSTPSKMFSSSVWSSSVESRNGEHWRPTLGSLHETSQTTLSDI